MSDSVGMLSDLRCKWKADALHADRVFSHALNIVNKIRTGAEKPPAATRLQLYGLYKQSMGARPIHAKRDWREG
jgi:hypothetical protein